ncbi:heavy metal sensor histidine kinase [Pseudomonas chlororaphis]|uniref:heavy metal sensor histidine kinase n=1 Tax=Pseudomonas chlororaphis TaxID=587753 RepID=UPI000D10B210|nr:heavy metal sensor histidine kinase [Pseudomonas chlororaphis]AVO59707.1 two-component sensor histidine kinase [Pseudomonas chlororaphis subsp. piscium]
MTRMSLTTRMSLMFMLAVTAVLTVAGLSFNNLSRHHFKMLDQQALNEKLQSTQRILTGLSSMNQFSDIKPELKVLLGEHRDLIALIIDGDGKLVFAEPGWVEVPQAFRRASNNNLWEWRDQGQMYRGVTAQARVTGQDKPLTIMVIFDVTQHMSFFEMLERWFWMGLMISALVSAALGWMVASSGLRPIRQVTQVAASMSAKSLQERIPLAPVPKELQQMVLSFNAMLSRLDDAFVRLSNFSADIAHELRTPVSNLMTHTEVVLSRKRNIEDYEDNLHSNLDDLKRMGRMIDDMLFLAKSDNGLITHENKPIDLVEVVEKLLEYYRLLADERGIDLEVSGRGSVRGDVLMLHRAISNLLSNALRYTPEGKCIRVDIQQKGTSISVVVENPGEPIAPEHLEKLFDRFYRVDSARREGSPSNAGLGLSITRSIIEAHDGKIWCTSSNGKTAFHIALPCAEAKQA